MNTFDVKKIGLMVLVLLMVCSMTGISSAGYLNAQSYTTLKGVVKDANGNPLKGLMVNVSTGECQISSSYNNKSCMVSCATNETGAFSVTVLKGFKYDIFVAADKTSFIGGYFRDTDQADNQWTGGVTSDWSLRTLIYAGSDVGAITITLKSGKKIFGNALTTDGKPVVGVWIEAQLVSQTPSTSANAWAGASTDTTGAFSIIVAPDAQYRLNSWAWKEGYQSGYWKSGEDSSLTASGQDGTLTQNVQESTVISTASDNEINILFEKGPTISGHVKDPDGNPVAGIWVSAESVPKCPEGAYCITTMMIYSFGALTNDQGYFEIAVYPASDYRVMISRTGAWMTLYYNNTTKWEEATLVDVSNGSVSDIDFTLNMGASISGTISGLKAGDKAHIEAWSRSTQGCGSVSVVGTGEQAVAFKIPGLIEASDYILTVGAENGGNYIKGCVQTDGTIGLCYHPTETDSTMARFKTGTTDVAITVNAGRTISGTISGVSQGVVVWINAYSETTWSKGDARITVQGETADFTISGLSAASDYILWVYADGYLSGYYGGAGVSPVSYEHRVPISVKDGDATGINIIMSKGQTISGVVKGLAKDAYAWISAQSASIGSYGGTKIIGTGSDVPYEISCLGSAADFKVSIWAAGYVSGYYSLSGVTDWQNATLVDTSSNPKTIDFELSKGNTISGTVTGLKTGEWGTIEAYRKGATYEPLDLTIKPDGECRTETNTSGLSLTNCLPYSGSSNRGMTAIQGTGEPVPYTITGLAPANDYIVVFRSFGYATQTKTNIDSSVNPTNVDFEASEGNAISGKISGVSPKKWVWINAWSETTWDYGYTHVQADADGKASFEIKGLGNASDYVISAGTESMMLYYNQKLAWKDADLVDLSAGSASGIDFAFDAIPHYVLSGTIAGVSDNTKVLIDAWSETAHAWGSAKVTGNNAFSIQLLEGTYRIGVYTKGLALFYDATTRTLIQDWTAATPVTVTADTDLGALTIVKGYSLSGVVVNTNGTAVAGVYVEVKNDTYHKTDVTNRKGKYSLSGLVNGTYTVTIQIPGGYYTGTVTIDNSDAVHNITLNPAEDTTTKNIREMAPSLSADSAMKTNSRMVLVLFDSNGKYVNIVETDANGNYSFGNLAPGTYTIKQEKADGSLEVLDTLMVK